MRSAKKRKIDDACDYYRLIIRVEEKVNKAE